MGKWRANFQIIGKTKISYMGEKKYTWSLSNNFFHTWFLQNSFLYNTSLKTLIVENMRWGLASFHSYEQHRWPFKQKFLSYRTLWSYENRRGSTIFQPNKLDRVLPFLKLEWTLLNKLKLIPDKVSGAIISKKCRSWCNLRL